MTNNTNYFDSQETTALTFVFLVIGIIVLAFTASFHIPNSGQHTGYVTSVEQSGIIWKTWTAYIKTDPQSSQEDKYCVTDPNVVSQLQFAAIQRDIVTVYYSVPWLTWKWQCGYEQSITQNITNPTVVTTQQLFLSNDSNPLSASFKCPEWYQTEKEADDAGSALLSAYFKKFPNANTDEFVAYKDNLLLVNSCYKTLNNLANLGLLPTK